MSEQTTKEPHGDVHLTVSKAYAEALKRAQQGGGGCCSGATPPAAETAPEAQSTSCCAPPVAAAHPASVAATMAGYTEDEMKQHGDAATSSFGCGNPLAFAGVEPGQTVLDLGSGAGFDLLIAAEKVGPTGKVIGVDMTPEMIAAARENMQHAGVADFVEIREGKIEALPVEEGSVDWLISNCVINLSPDKPAVFAEVARVLKPGGRFSVSDIVAQDLPEAIKKSAEAYSACIGGAISEEEYVGGLRAAGLVDVEVTERFVYEAAQLKGLIGSDLEAFGVPVAMLDAALDQVVGKVWSAKVVGRKA